MILNQWIHTVQWPCTHLYVGEAHTSQVSRHLQAKGPHLLQALHGMVFNLLQSVILGWIINLLQTHTHTHELL